MQHRFHNEAGRIFSIIPVEVSEKSRYRISHRYRDFVFCLIYPLETDVSSGSSVSASRASSQ